MKEGQYDMISGVWIWKVIHNFITYWVLNLFIFRKKI